ncbi:alanine dehydrogenase [Bacteroidales bacterium]|nr:alanine dehydrogenase [Bacteroidales bacterium]
MKSSSACIGETFLQSQELMKEVHKSKQKMILGIPKEREKCEKRLALSPEAVEMLVEAGYRVLLERGAGNKANYSDNDYSEAGAEIISEVEVVFKSDLIFKISPPTHAEINMMNNKAIVCSMLELPNFSLSAIKAMMSKQINAVGYELLSIDGLSFPVRDSISEIEGAASISIASEFLSNDHGGKGLLLGGVPGLSPTELVIIGAGVAGTVAAHTALSLGASVKVFDNNIDKLRKIQQNLGSSLFTSVFHPRVLTRAFKSADVVIGAMLYINTNERYVISEDVIKQMKKGALIIDLRVNQGGCFETSCFLPEDHPQIFEEHGIMHYCVPNLSSRVARTTTMSLSNILIPMITQMVDQGIARGIAQIDPGFRSGLYLYGGKFVSSYVASHFNMPSNDIGLFLSVC